METRVGTGQVMPHQAVHVAIVEAARDLLERREVQLHLVQPSADALAVLLDETGDTPAGNDAGEQYHAIQQSAQHARPGSFPYRKDFENPSDSSDGLELMSTSPSFTLKRSYSARIAQDPNLSCAPRP